MLTNRGRWLILISAGAAVLGLIGSRERLALVSLSILCWIFLEWVLFRIRVDWSVSRLTCTRRVNGSDSPEGTLWSGRTNEIVTAIHSRSAMPFSSIRFEDYLSDNLHCTEGAGPNGVPEVDATLRSYGSMEIVWTAKARAAGRVRLPGVCVRICDLQGLFFAQRFVACEQTFRVLPLCADVEISRPISKRVNALPPPGIHRLQKPGMGSELLELREYVPGDPPKSIAWKVSARRDTLMTREYESEVPVRTTLFVDVSNGAQAGSFGLRAIDRSVFVAATVARGAMAVRDPVSIVLFDERDTRHLGPGSGDRHFYRLLDLLSSACSHRTTSEQLTLSPALMHQAWDQATALYPEMLSRGTGRIPFTIFPISPARRFVYHRRLRLGYLISELFELGPDAPLRLAHDDRMMADYTHRFLTRIGAAQRDIRQQKSVDDSKADVLASSLVRAVSRGRDNELFVLLADLLEYDGKLDALTDAVRLARARHHRVVVICPWPERIRPANDSARIVPQDVNTDELVRRAETERLRMAANRLKAELMRWHVPVAFTADEQAIRLVLSEAELTRDGRSFRAAAI